LMKIRCSRPMRSRSRTRFSLGQGSAVYTFPFDQRLDPGCTSPANRSA